MPTMNRRVALVSAGIAALGIATPTLAAGTPMSDGSPVASPSTPVAATPIVNAKGSITLIGLKAWTSRYFDSPQGKINFDPAGLQFAFGRFDTPDHADKALTGYVPAILETRFPGDDVSDVRPTGVRNFGERTEAYSGRVVPTTGSDSSFQVAYITVRIGSLMYFAYGWGWLFNPFPKLPDIVEKMTLRAPSADPIQVDDLGMHIGGDWAVIPVLADVPEGMRFNEDGSS